VEGVVILDDFLPNELFEDIKAHLRDIPWTYMPTISRKALGKSVECQLNNNGLVHVLIGPGNQIFSPYVSLFNTVLDVIEDKTHLQEILPIRMKVNLTLFNSFNRAVGTEHIDLLPSMATNFYSAVLYLNDNDGGTLIYNYPISFAEEDVRNITSVEISEKIEQANLANVESLYVTPKENRLVIFPGNYVHEGHYPVQYKEKYALNIAFTAITKQP
jgi:hypothetical protein